MESEFIKNLKRNFSLKGKTCCNPIELQNKERESRRESGERDINSSLRQVSERVRGLKEENIVMITFISKPRFDGSFAEMESDVDVENDLICFISCD